jgi:lipopolysaccharide/colanic/teichoic acid biosynthesis glycosyltransferase
MIKLVVKRCFDMAGAAGLLILLAPLMLVVAIVIKLDSPGGIFFRQKRLGKASQTFRIWKFRTMVENAVNQGAGLVTFQNDPRITRIGAWLRKYRIDEIPQFFNVLTGEMSLVGPRPLLPEYLHAYSERDRRRLLVKPGVTGWQQVNGGSQNTWDERITLDQWYIDNWSLWVDLKVILRTISIVLKADTVYGKDGWQRSGYPTSLSAPARDPIDERDNAGRS